MKRNMPGCGCCNCGVAGFDIPYTWGAVVSCWPDCVDYIVDLADDIDRIDRCSHVFTGYLGCGVAPAFTADQYPDLEAWVTNGGRLWVGGEYQGCSTASVVNTLLSGIHSVMRLASRICNCGCSPDWKGIKGTTALTEDVDYVLHACVGEVQNAPKVVASNNVVSPSGMAFAPCPTSLPIMGLEAKGQGWIILTADSNILTCGAATGCPILEKWRTLTNEELTA